jgi:hypothetical protein
MRLGLMLRLQLKLSSPNQPYNRAESTVILLPQLFSSAQKLALQYAVLAVSFRPDGKGGRPISSSMRRYNNQ